MKSFVALAFVALIAGAMCVSIDNLSAEQKAKAKAYAEECIKQENVTEEEALKIRQKDFVNASDNVKCFANCFFQKTGTLMNGEVQDAVVLQKLGAVIGEDKTKQIMQKCNGLKGENECDSAFKLYMCYENAKTELML